MKKISPLMKEAKIISSLKKALAVEGFKSGKVMGRAN